jgi:hypothetical protein
MSDIQAELAELRREVERLKARETIRQTLARYGRGQEWLEPTLLDEVFWDDAQMDFGFFRGPWREYRPVLMEIEARGQSTYHFLGASQIEFEGEDRAYVDCYGLAGGRGAEATQIYGGRYLQVFERRGGVWKSASCRYVLDWTMRQPADSAVGDALAGINSVKDRSSTHPWFRRMGAEATV